MLGSTSGMPWARRTVGLLARFRHGYLWLREFAVCSPDGAPSSPLKRGQTKIGFAF